MKKNIILIADDMKVNRTVLALIFKEQYDILEAKDGEETIKLLEQNSDDIVLLFLDLKMPKKTGLDVLKFMVLSQLIDQIPVIMITGEATDETDISAYNAGVSDIIYKPFEPTIVMRRAQNLIELFKHKQHLEEEVKQQKEELRRQTLELKEKEKLIQSNNEFLIDALSSVVEFRSSETGTHIRRVKFFTSVMLSHLKELYPEYRLTDEMITQIVSASALHDIGKVAIPDSILQKPGKLTNEERKIMEGHSAYGCEILEKFKQTDSDFYNYCYDICRYHHERYDGGGYPDKLVGEDIPIWAQVVSVADVFDALVSKRVYKLPYAADEAYRMVKEGECGAFSEKILNCLEASKLEFFKAINEELDFIEQ